MNTFWSQGWDVNPWRWWTTVSHQRQKQPKHPNMIIPNKTAQKNYIAGGRSSLYTRLYHDWVTITTTTALKRLSKCVVVLITSRKSYNHLPKQGFALNHWKATVSNAFSLFCLPFGSVPLLQQNLLPFKTPRSPPLHCVPVEHAVTSACDWVWGFWETRCNHRPFLQVHLLEKVKRGYWILTDTKMCWTEARC